MLAIRKNMGQVSLELATAFVCMFILMIASIKICSWVIDKMAVRQQDYESSRVNAGDEASGQFGAQVNESDTTKYKKLRLFE
jgi:hypothetical protein